MQRAVPEKKKVKEIKSTDLKEECPRTLHPRFSLRSRLLPSTSTKVASTIVSCDLQSRLWMLLYSGLPIAERLEFRSRHVEQRNTWNRGARGKRGTRGTRGTRGEAKTKSMPWPHSTGIKGATHFEYNRG